MSELLSVDVHEFCVHRENVMEEVLQWYETDSEMPFRKLRISFSGERGDDFGGLTKDLFTSLWNELLQAFFIGKSAVIPFLPVHQHVSRRHYFPAIGRILSHTAALLSYVPARISCSTLLCLALDSSHVTDELVMEDIRKVFSAP